MFNAYSWVNSHPGLLDVANERNSLNMSHRYTQVLDVENFSHFSKSSVESKSMSVSRTHPLGSPSAGFLWAISRKKWGNACEHVRRR